MNRRALLSAGLLMAFPSLVAAQGPGGSGRPNGNPQRPPSGERPSNLPSRPGPGNPPVNNPPPSHPRPPAHSRPPAHRPQPPRPSPSPPPGAHRPGAGRPPSFHPVHGPRWRYPAGWRYRRWTVGAALPALFLSLAYRYDDYDRLGLSGPPWGYRWVRFGPDLLLVEERSGRVTDVIYGAFY